MEKADNPKIYKHSCIGKSRHVAFVNPAREQKANTVKSKGIIAAQFLQLVVAVGIKLQQISKKADIKENNKGGQNEKIHIAAVSGIMFISGIPAGAPNFNGRMKMKKSVANKINLKKKLLVEQVLFTL